MGLFALLGDEDPAPEIPIPKLPEFTPSEKMNMEKETTGLYLSGHPMDDYRPYLKNTHVVPIAQLLDDEEGQFRDDQVVSVAGAVQSVKMKTTRNNSMMAYVTLEDDTGSVEMLAFSRILEEYGGYLKENTVIVVTGRLSIREEKEPQIVVNRARPITDFANGEPPVEDAPAPAVLPGEKLYLKLESRDSPLTPKVRAIVNMFPGESQAVLFFADTRTRMGKLCSFDRDMVEELRRVLGNDNVVLK